MGRRFQTFKDTRHYAIRRALFKVHPEIDPDKVCLDVRRFFAATFEEVNRRRGGQLAGDLAAVTGLPVDAIEPILAGQFDDIDEPVMLLAICETRSEHRALPIFPDREPVDLRRCALGMGETRDLYAETRQRNKLRGIRRNAWRTAEGRQARLASDSAGTTSTSTTSDDDGAESAGLGR